MSDAVEHIDGSIIQHGAGNNRIYLMHFGPADPPGLIGTLDALATKNGYGKILAKIPATAWPVFRSCGYLKEAVVPGFFNGRTDGFFIAKYFSTERQNDPSRGKRLQDIRRTGTGSAGHIDQCGRADLAVVACQSSDAGEMSTLYRQVFQSYPFPIHRPDYLQHMMDEGVRYFCIRVTGRIAAIAATEIDAGAENAEMTDFAARPEWQGQGLAGMLLDHMDRKATERGLKTAYTIARAESPGMNRVFKRQGYRYAGWLPNNTQIGGHIESMIVWYRRLGAKEASSPFLNSIDG